MKDEQGQVGRSQGKLTLAELYDHYKKTVQHQGLKTVIQETYVADRIKGNWPTGSLIQVVKVRPSDVDMWRVTNSAQRRGTFTFRCWRFLDSGNVPEIEL